MSELLPKNLPIQRERYKPISIKNIKNKLLEKGIILSYENIMYSGDKNTQHTEEIKNMFAELHSLFTENNDVIPTNINTEDLNGVIKIIDREFIFQRLVKKPENKLNGSENDVIYDFISFENYQELLKKTSEYQTKRLKEIEEKRAKLIDEIDKTKELLGIVGEIASEKPKSEINELDSIEVSEKYLIGLQEFENGINTGHMKVGILKEPIKLGEKIHFSNGETTDIVTQITENNGIYIIKTNSLEYRFNKEKNTFKIPDKYINE